MPNDPAVIDPPATTAPPPAAAPAPAPAPAPEPSLLADAGQAASIDWIPEKFRVNGADGKLDLTASAKKVEEHRSHLEKRLGAGDIPPKTADEYKLTLPEELKDAIKADDPLLADFRAKALAVGFTQAQFDTAIGEYLTRATQFVEQKDEASRSTCESSLREVWKTEDEYRAQISAGFRAVQTFAPNAEAMLAKFGNDPEFVRFAAAIGKEIKEDRPPSEGTGVPPADFAVRAAALRDEIAKMPHHDPRRKQLQGEYDSLYAKAYGTRVLGGDGVMRDAPKR